MRKRIRMYALLLVVIMIVQLGAQNGIAVKAAESDTEGVLEYDLEKCITSAKLTAQIDGIWRDVTTLTEQGLTVPKDAPVDVKITYNPENIKFAPGARLTYQIPNGISIPEEQNGNIMDGPGIAGTYIIQTDGQIVILLNDDYLKKHDGYVKNGTISMSCRFEREVWGEGGSKEIKFGETVLIVPFTPDPVVTKGILNLQKTIIKEDTKEIRYDEDSQSYYIEYKLTVSTPADNTMTLHNVTVEDRFTAGGNYIYQIEDIDTGDVGTFAYHAEKELWEWRDIGDMAPGDAHELTFKARLLNDIVKDGGMVDRVITNQAVGYSDGTKKNEVSVTAKMTAALNISKSTTGYDAVAGTVGYTVKVKAADKNTWQLENVTVSDIFGTNKQYVEEYLSVEASKGMAAKAAGAEKQLDWSIGTMAPGEEQTLRYTVKIGAGMFLQGSAATTEGVLDNKATLFVNGKNTGSASARVNYKKVWIWKNGELQPDGRIRFSVHANETTTAIAVPPIDSAFTFKDELGGAWVYDGNIQIRRYTGGPSPLGNAVGEPVILDADGKTSWTWTENLKGVYYYEFIYYARLKESVIGTPSIKNTVSIEGEWGGIPFHHKTTWSGTGKSNKSIFKEWISQKGNIADWQSKIIANVPEGAVYSDWRNTGQGRTWTFSDGQIAAVTVTAGGVLQKAGESYSIKRTATGFDITFLKPLEATVESPILIAYQSTLQTDDLAEGTSGTYVNQAKLVINGQEDSARAECSYTKEQLIKKTTGTYRSDTGEMTWKIYVNLTGSMHGEAVVTDLLPEGLSYVKAEIAERGNSAEAAKTTMTVTVNDRIVTMNLNELAETHQANAYIMIALTTKIADREFFLSNSSRRFLNTARVLYDGTEKEATAEWEITNTALKKGGVYDGNTAPNIIYTIEVNPAGVDMLEDEAVIRVEDVMGEGMMLKSDTLLVKNKVTGEEIDVRKTLKINKNIFSFEVPDDQPIIITYQAYVMGAAGDKATVTNTVSYYGRSEEVVEWSREIIILESKATIEGNPAFYISKRDGEDITRLLAGAEFTLYQTTIEGTLKEVRTEISDDEGLVYFTGLNDGNVYAFRETKAPEGYDIDAENGAYTFIAFRKEAIRDDMEHLDVSVIQNGITYERYNYKTVKPEDPKNPENPEKPEDPQKPEKPKENNPVNKEEKKPQTGILQETANTGDHTAFWPYLLLIMIAGAGILFWILKRDGKTFLRKNE